MRTKGHTVLVDLTQFTQAENLKPARVGEDGTWPRHKLMQPAHPAHGLNSRPQVKMIGVAENDLRPQVLENILRNSFHRRHRSYRHKHGRLDFSMGREKAPCTSFAARAIGVEGDGHYSRDCSNRELSEPKGSTSVGASSRSRN